MSTGKKKWQIMTLAAIGAVIIILAGLRAWASYHIDEVVIVDLVLGIFSLVLAIYVYNKEKMLEERVDRITVDKTRNAYLDILINLLIFGRILDNMLISGYKAGSTHMKIMDSFNVQLFHRNLRMVFVAHIDVIDKNVMGRLA